MISKLNITILIVASTIIFSGCGSKKDTPKPPKQKIEFDKVINLQLEKPISETKVYIDNSFDTARVKNIQSFFNHELIHGEEFEDYEIDLPYKGVFEKANEYLKIYTYGIRTYVKGYTSQDFNIFFNSEINFDRTKIHTNKEGIYSNQFKSIDEIVNAYRDLMSDIGRLSTRKFGIQVPFNLDINSLEQNQFLLSNQYLKDYSMKEQLIKVLKDEGFIIVNNKKEADITFVVENLGFGKVKYVAKYIKAPVMLPTNFMYEGVNTGAGFYNTMKSTGGNTHYASNVAMGFMAAGLVLSLFDNSGDFISTYNAISVFNKEKKIGMLFNASKSFVELKDDEKFFYTALLDKSIENANKTAVGDLLLKLNIKDKN